MYTLNVWLLCRGSACPWWGPMICRCSQPSSAPSMCLSPAWCCLTCPRRYALLLLPRLRGPRFHILYACRKIAYPSMLPCRKIAYPSMLANPRIVYPAMLVRPAAPFSGCKFPALAIDCVLRHAALSNGHLKQSCMCMKLLAVILVRTPKAVGAGERVLHCSIGYVQWLALLPDASHIQLPLCAILITSLWAVSHAAWLSYTVFRTDQASWRKSPCSHCCNLMCAFVPVNDESRRRDGTMPEAESTRLHDAWLQHERAELQPELFRQNQHKPH